MVMIMACETMCRVRKEETNGWTLGNIHVEL